MSEETTKGTLKEGEYHPSAEQALIFVQALSIEEKMRWAESFASTAIEGNRLAEILSETMQRVLKAEGVSDRYLLGLAWFIKTAMENERKDGGIGDEYLIKVNGEDINYKSADGLISYKDICDISGFDSDHVITISIHYKSDRKGRTVTKKQHAELENNMNINAVFIP